MLRAYPAHAISAPKAAFRPEGPKRLGPQRANGLQQGGLVSQPANPPASQLPASQPAIKPASHQAHQPAKPSKARQSAASNLSPVSGVQSSPKRTAVINHASRISRACDFSSESCFQARRAKKDLGLREPQGGLGEPASQSASQPASQPASVASQAGIKPASHKSPPASSQQPCQ